MAFQGRSIWLDGGRGEANRRSERAMQQSMSLPPGLEFLARGTSEPFVASVPTRRSAEGAEESLPWDSAAGVVDVQDPVRSPSASKVAVKAAQELAQAMRETMAQELQSKVMDRLEEVWAQGEQATLQFMDESRSQMDQVAAKVAEFQEKQREMEAESAGLQQVLATVLGQLSGISGTLAMGRTPLGSPSQELFDLAPLEALTASLPDLSPGGTPSTTAPSSTGPISPIFTFDCPSTTYFEPMAGGAVGRPLAAGTAGCFFDQALTASSSGSANGTTRDQLPEVPAFPFPAPPADAPSSRSAAPLSLADALGIEGGVAGTGGLDVTATSRLQCPATQQAFPVFTPAEPVAGDGFVFSIQLRKAEGVVLGLETVIDAVEGRDVLCISGISPGGAAEAWNRQCSSSGAAEKVLALGDRIVSVNSLSGTPEEMQRECELHSLLRLMVVRDVSPQLGLLYPMGNCYTSSFEPCWGGVPELAM